MLKKAIGILVILSLIGIIGCSSGAKSTATTAAPGSVKTVREAQIASTWTMKQLEVNTATGITLVLTLAAGDKVDGYFYLEKGSDISFQIAGNSQIYASQPAGAKSSTITSDRFSFTASQAQGIAYNLTFSSGSASNEKTGATIFLELIYPATGSLYVPIGTK